MASFPWKQYAFTLVGIVISVVLPILRKKLPTMFGYAAALPVKVNTYLVVGLFAVLTAILVIAFGGSQVNEWQWYTAVLAGYAWDSTLQKIVHG